MSTALRELKITSDDLEDAGDSDSDDIEMPRWRARVAGHAKNLGGKGPVKWILPAILVVISSLICMWMLHIATFYYVKGILRFEAAFQPTPGYHEDASTKQFFSAGLSNDSVSYGSLQDPLEAQLGYKDVPLKALDAVALVFPMLWFGAVIYLQDVQAWTKVLLCHSVLAFGKGIFGATTIIPDSIGWANCKKRLGEQGLKYFQNEVPDPTTHGLWTMVMAILGVELAGPHQDRIGSGMRFCGDMIYSGHTYFTILYILALCELVRKAVSDPDSKVFIDSSWKRKLVVFGVYLVCIAQQGLEIFLVLSNRFHYTTDVVLAVLLTFLWYTSAPICIAAKWWAQLGTKMKQEREGPEDMVLIPRSALSGDVWLPVFCFPFCCINGHHHVISETQLRLWHEDGERTEADFSSCF